ncbi:MAG: hypothetical protein J7M26_07780 [Armatimonadetes bacterium]|nr:hypothetical protein [Armatimonadota bacterium]
MRLEESRSLTGRTGVTVAEALVVLAMIIALAAIAVGLSVVVHNQAKVVACADRMHMIYAAVKMYTEDYNGYLPLVYFGHGLDECTKKHPCAYCVPIHIPSPPRDYGIDVALGDYISDHETFFCPAARRDPRQHKDVHASGHYQYNASAVDLRLDQIRPPLNECAILTCPGPVHWGGRNHRLYLDGHMVMVKCNTGLSPFRGPIATEFLGKHLTPPPGTKLYPPP